MRIAQDLITAAAHLVERSGGAGFEVGYLDAPIPASGKLQGAPRKGPPLTYSRNRLAKIAQSLRAAHAQLDGAGLVASDEVDDLAHAAAFLEDTVGVLDAQAKARRQRAAQDIIDRKRNRRRKGRR